MPRHPHLISPALTVKKLNEYEIAEDLHGQITNLRNECWPDKQKPRSYYKQIPHIRYLAFEDDKLIGHAAVDHRVIAVGEMPVRIFGVVDVCVALSHRGQGLASRLLREVEELASTSGADALLLIADDPRLYLRNGFEAVVAHVAWLRIHEHLNYGVAFERLEGDVMVKPLGTERWPDGSIDLLGFMF